MNKEEKVNYIKAWLQMFGERDNETFNVSVKVGKITWDISMQYSYDLEECYKTEPYSWCRSGFKHLHKNGIDDRSDEELTSIIEELQIMQLFY